MSVIKLTDHDECIYNWKILRDTRTTKPPPYHSKFVNKIKRELDQVKKSNNHKDFGYAEVPLAKPSEFLKKDMGINRPKPAIEGRQCVLDHRRPPIPAAKPPPAKSDKNFIRENIVQATSKSPKEPEHKIVDTVHGDVFLLDPSGMEPHYRNKDNYGKIPVYLFKFKKEHEEKQRLRREVRERKENQGAFYIPSGERNDMIAGMKENWQELMRFYQTLPILTDTERKIRNKMKLEAQLKQLEKDIAMMERHPIIYVMSNQKDFNPA